MNYKQLEVKAIGYFLAAYETDLIFIRNFQRFKKKEILAHNYVLKENGTFYNFFECPPLYLIFCDTATTTLSKSFFPKYLLFIL
jgi:hypothetical protein